ncbi:uncharacterized protein LOC129238333 [Anastrepha obliqua]|uniref:uncharacterized protein LOC129238333 n=1 Tax=Anastrepha obliqua TaxID=95512 RepID=UPI002409DEC4|nr:uncharacterized protein LOC129238333 [Anastrepha obliqua]
MEEIRERRDRVVQSIKLVSHFDGDRNYLSLFIGSIDNIIPPFTSLTNEEKPFYFQCIVSTLRGAALDVIRREQPSDWLTLRELLISEFTANKSLSQPNVKDFFEQVESISTKDSTRSKKITEAIVNFIIMDNKPFYAVEGKGFLQLMKGLVPLYKVPSRETVKLRVDEKYEALSCAFKEYIRKSDTYCLTYDIWTEQMKNESFMGVTIHFLDNLHLLSGTLGLIELRESHTAAYLGEKLSRLFIEWNVVTDKVSACITDNDSTMMKINRNLFGDNKIIPCFAHTINLVVTQAIDKSTKVSPLISKVRDIVMFITRSVNASDDLREKQMEAGTSEGTTKKMILDVKTRWNSCFYMLERFVQLSSFLSEVLLTRPEAPSMVNGSKLNNIKEVIELLKSFETVTREISADSYVTVSKIIPLNKKHTQTGLSSIENEEHEDTTFEDNTPGAKKAKTEFGKKEKQELLKKAVKALEDSTRPNDDASTFSSTWEVLFRKLDPTQQLFANKTIMEVLYQGTFGQLNENSHQLFNVQNTRCSSRPLSYSDNSSTCFDKRTMQNRSSTPFSYSDNSSTCFVARTVQNRPEYIISPPLSIPTQLISTPASQVQYTRFHSTVQPQQYQQISSINIQPQETINTQQYGNNTEYRTFSDLLNDSEYS